VEIMNNNGDNAQQSAFRYQLTKPKWLACVECQRARLLHADGTDTGAMYTMENPV